MTDKKKEAKAAKTEKAPSEIVKLMFDGEELECLVQTDRAGEIVATARNGRFAKFPKGTKLNAAVIKKHNKANADKPDPAGTDEAAAEELANWLDSK